MASLSMVMILTYVCNLQERESWEQAVQNANSKSEESSASYTEASQRLQEAERDLSSVTKELQEARVQLRNLDSQPRGFSLEDAEQQMQTALQGWHQFPFFSSL